jgi:excisionase family DNA binding protein
MQDRGFYTVEQAADTLELTRGRIRQMLRGGDLEGSKEPGDRGWRITRESVEVLRREDEYLLRQLDQATERDRENRRLLAAALERIPPQLEAPAEERECDIGEALLTPTEAAAGPQTETSQPQRSIWRRLFGR